MVLLFANPFSQYIPLISRSYAYPFFQQKWNMFVPAPSGNYRLFVDFECKGTQRYDLFQRLVFMHQDNRFSGGEPLVLAFSNSIHYFEHHTTERGRLNGPVRNDRLFSMIEHSALNLVKQLHGCETDSVKIILLVEDYNGNARAYFN